MGLEKAAGERVLNRTRTGKGFEYEFLVAFEIDGQEVPATVKKN